MAWARILLVFESFEGAPPRHLFYEFIRDFGKTHTTFMVLLGPQPLLLLTCTYSIRSNPLVFN